MQNSILAPFSLISIHDKGVLLSSIIGNDLRTTKDIDATLKGLPLTIEMVEEIFKEILSIDIKDNVYFDDSDFNEFVAFHLCVFEKTFSLRSE